jgi:glutathione peroxidase
MKTLADFAMHDIEGHPTPLADFAGKVVLVVNVASLCRLTPQYEGLQRLYDQYRRQGLEILAFPCNQFMEREPGSPAEIRDFAALQFGATFPLFAKVDVNGEERAPLYAWLVGSDAGKGGDIEWNFEKFLLDREGQVQRRFPPQVEPCSREVKQAIESLLPS